MSFTTLLADNAGNALLSLPLYLHPTRRAAPLRGTSSVPSTTRPEPAPSTRVVRIARDAEPLGAASAAGRWRWAGATSPVSARIPSAPVSAVRISPLLLDEMSAAARAQCRSLSDIWAEAAHEWLRNHAQEYEPQPPTPAAAALAVPRPARSWTAIDTVLADLRRSPDTAA